MRLDLHHIKFHLEKAFGCLHSIKLAKVAYATTLLSLLIDWTHYMPIFTFRRFMLQICWLWQHIFILDLKQNWIRCSILNCRKYKLCALSREKYYSYNFVTRYYQTSTYTDFFNIRYFIYNYFVFWCVDQLFLIFSLIMILICNLIMIRSP